jgi:Transcriptional regulatory protein, C terminal
MPSEPTFTKLLQEAVDAGHVVFVHTPKPPPTPPIVPLYERDETSLAVALGLVFKLSHSESRILANLMRHEHRSKEELRAIATYNATTTSIVSVLVYSLRKKLKPYNVEIFTVRKLGYGLDKRARDRIQKIFAAHDKAIIAARLKSETIEPEHSEEHG